MEIKFLKDYNDYIEYGQQKPKYKFKYNKVSFICKQCNLFSVKAFRSLTPEFLCTSCTSSNGQTEECKEKIKQTCLKKYGTSNVHQNIEIKNKAKQTCIKKYGHESYTQTEECKEKMKTTTIKKYGVDNYTKTDEYKEKCKQTCLTKYGVDNYTKTDEYKEKCKQTCLTKYGSEYFFQSDFFKTLYNTQIYNILYQDNKINIANKLKTLNLSINTSNKFDTTIDIYCINCMKSFSISRSYFYKLLSSSVSFCPYCSKSSNKSIKEKELLGYIKTLYNGIILENDRTMLNGKELDIYLPDLKLGFEFDGTYWHMDPRFHTATDILFQKNITAQEIWARDEKKNILCNTLGIKLIRIKEYDWDNDIDNIKNQIKIVILSYTN